MNNILKNLILIECMLLSIVSYRSSVNVFNCHLPERCRIKNIYNSENFYSYNQKELYTYPQIICDVTDNEEFELNFKDPTPLMNSDEKCSTNFYGYITINYIIFKWTWSSNEAKILEKRFNFTNVMRYLSFFKPYVYINFWSLNGFDVNFLGESYNMTVKSLSGIALLDCSLNFYHNKRKINSCQHFSDLNITQIRSIFQIRYDNKDFYRRIELKNIKYKESICPFVFQNAKIGCVLFNDLVDTFYKKNVLTFSNETYPQLNSDIESVQLYNCYNINIDLNLLHQSVFYNLKNIFIERGSFKSISGEIFKNFKNVSKIEIYDMISKKINHKQGIEWIKQMNFGINVNFSNKPSKEDYKHFLKNIDMNLKRDTNNKNIPITVLFPEEDFCIYVDFPLNQLVVVKEFNFD